MDISNVSNGASLYGIGTVKSEAAPKAEKPPERPASQPDSAQVRLSAEAQSKSASLQAQDDPEQSRKVLQEQDRHADQAQQAAAQQGFSFYGAGAYSRISSS